MLLTLFSIFIRIVSNSYINVFQKILSSFGQRSSSINFYTYLGLTLISLCFLFGSSYSYELLINVLIMGLLGALGNYFIIKALSVGELSVLAPINSYKPVVALFAGIFFLKEIPSFISVIAIVLIILGTFILYDSKINTTKMAVFYRILALIFSGTEAIFIKKVIILTNVNQSFALWAISGLIFSLFFILKPNVDLKLKSYKYQLFLILSVALMQYSTNFVFSKINVSSALAIFQLSTILSVFLGAEIFKEKNLKRKIIASCVMIFGAIILILYS